jgi:hypothetical protein
MEVKLSVSPCRAECWTRNGRHSKKCPNLYLSETPEQREKRLKKEERLRDQELGAGNI